jgi:hypothetical protein
VPAEEGAVNVIVCGEEETPVDWAAWVFAEEQELLEVL